MNHSDVISIYLGDSPVGFARIISDYATFAWICDVWVDPNHRGKGLGKELMKQVMRHPSTQVPHLCLGTKDAQGLYKKYGFEHREMMFCKREKIV